ncbi:SAVED domain-containing protein [Paenibacillus solani]|uniref:SAVED domain-containing protein n=1 Tax=Paenibacillus solani TaxID=1705565 RepID=UPI003D26C0D5
MASGTIFTLGIMGIVFIIGIIFMIRHFRSHQREEGIAYFIIMFGSEVVATSFGTLDDKIIAFLRHNDVDTNYAQIISGFILIGIGVFLMFHSRNKMYILNLNGMFHDRRIDNHHKEVGLSPFQFKEKEVDFVRLYKKTMNADIAAEIIEEIKHKVEVFKQESKDKKRGYTGIASIPFVLFAGKYFERSVMHDYFEYDKFQQVYYRLTSKHRFPKLSLSQNDAITRLQSIHCVEVVIAISITASIRAEQLVQFTCPQLYLSVPNPNDNLIKHKEQLHSYVEKTYDVLKETHERIPNLKKIHLVISSQSCFAFKLGQLIEDTRMPMVISYQYNAQSSPKYPWGIIINGDQKGDFVQF